jgi:hypothetical protein
VTGQPETPMKHQRRVETIPIRRTILIAIGACIAIAVPIFLLLTMISEDRQGSQYVPFPGHPAVVFSPHIRPPTP